MPDGAWDGGGAARLTREAAALRAEIGAAGRPVYDTPFDDRPDILVLQERERSRTLINV